MSIEYAEIVPPKCPRCGSIHAAIAKRVPGPGVYFCRHRFHMPTPEAEAVELVAAFDEFCGANPGMPLRADLLEQLERTVYL